MKVLVLMVLQLVNLSLVTGCDQEFRLHGGNYSGWAQVSANDQWYNICYGNTNTANSTANAIARILCTQLGCANANSYEVDNSQLEASYEITCLGNELMVCNCALLLSNGCERWLFISCIQAPRIRSVTSMETSLDIQWSSLSCLQEQNSYGYMFRVTCKQDGSSIQHTTSVAISKVMARVANLFPFTNYKCNVSLFTLSIPNFMLQSNVYNRKTLPVRPSAPQSVHLSPRAHSATLRWSPPQYSNGSVLYSIRCAGYRTQTYYYMVVIEELHPYTTYTCCVSATNSVGEGRQDCVQFQSLEAAPTQSPQNLEATVVNARNVVIQWGPPEETHRNGRIRNYIITVYSIKEGQMVLTYYPTMAYFNLTTLRPFHEYTISVLAFTVAKGPSTYIIIHTAEAAPSQSPQKLYIEEVSESHVAIRWSPPEENHRNGRILNYIITVYGIKEGQLVHTYNTTIGYFNLTLLQPFHEYTITVLAFTIAKGPSINITFHTSEAAPTQSPQDLRIVDRNETHVKIQWRPPEENFRNGMIRYYTITVKGMKEKPAVTTYKTTNSYFILISLETSQSYTVNVAAFTIAEGPYAGILVPATDTQSVAAAGYVGLSLGFIFIIIVIFTIIVVIFKIARKNSLILKNKNKQDKKLSDTTNTLPTQFVLHNATFINEKNAHLFFEREGSEKISENSSLVLELPERQYLDDDDFVNELDPRPITLAMLKSDDRAAGPEKGLPKHIIIKDTSFINDKNFALFVETNDNNPTPENLSLSDDVIPELPKRGYLENENFTERTYMSLGAAAEMKSSAGEYMVLQQASRRMQSSALDTGAQSKQVYSDLIIDQQLKPTDQQATGNYMSLRKR